MRPRERYTLEGPDRFGDSELLALVLGTGCAGRPVRSIAEHVLEVGGGLGGLADLPVGALARVTGVGPARAVRLHAALHLGRRVLAQPGPEAAVHTSEDAFRWFSCRLAGLQQEELHGLFLNRRNSVRAYRVLTRGNDAHTIVDPRQVFRQALLVGATGIIVAHNHPSGDPTPSGADRDVTRRLVEAGQLLGLDILDHIVVAGDRYCSLAEEGLLPMAPRAPSPVVAARTSSRR